MTSDMKSIAVIGLGYVGLPLAVEFGKSRPVIGFDLNERRIDALRDGRDATQEVSAQELAAASYLSYTTDSADLAGASIYIVTVPTPIDAHKRPDLTPLIKASETLGRVLKRGDIVIYESTVYPGATEEDCVPVLERVSGLTFNEDFLRATAPNVSIPVTSSIACPTFARLHPDRHQMSPRKLISFMRASSPPAPIRQKVFAWQRQPR